MINHDNFGVRKLNHQSKIRLDAELEKIIFVIPSINGGRLLERMLPTLNLPPSVIYVLDQGSSDSTQHICDKFKVNIVQLNDPHTYTQCCNIALRIALDMKVDFFFISNNDISFVTDVGRELLHEIMCDGNLGMLSCSQVVTDEQRSNPILSNRVYWDLGALNFEHETANLGSEYYRVESDFCELTCAVMRTSAIAAVGGFDDGYGFYHEDADLGFRLREAGYTTAYLPQSQIEHFAGSTFNQGLGQARLNYIAKSKSLFERKHSGFGVNYSDFMSDVPSSWTIINRNLFKNLKYLGLIDSDRAALTFAHPGARPLDYLYTVWETDSLPAKWLPFADAYKAVFLPSQWNLDVFRASGFQNTHYVPLGADTDVFHPWAEVERAYDEPTFLWFSRNQYRKGLDVLLSVWRAFRIRRPGAKLIVMGHGILTESDVPLSKMRRWREYLIYEDFDHGIIYKEILTPLSEREVAKIYRSVDAVLVTSRSEGFGFNVVEALACGAMVIFPSYGATADMIFPGALTFGGKKISANYSDKDFYDVGSWWEPCEEEILIAMEKVSDMSASLRAELFRLGSNMVRSKFSWRTTAFSMRNALKNYQTRRPKKLTNIIGPINFTSWLRKSLEDGSADFLPVSYLTSLNIEDIFSDFDRGAYLDVNKDLPNLLMDPLWHFLRYGWLEGRMVSVSQGAADFLCSSNEKMCFIAYINNVGMIYDCDSLRRRFFEWEVDKLRQVIEKQSLSNISFLKLVYNVILKREPDPSGLQSHLELLFEQKFSQKGILENIVNSAEARLLHSL